jgi:hypothetical protein
MVSNQRRQRIRYAFCWTCSSVLLLLGVALLLAKRKLSSVNITPNARCNYLMFNQTPSGQGYALPIACVDPNVMRWNEKSLTVAILYHNDVEHLKAQILGWEALDRQLKSALLFLVIDDGSRDKAIEVTDITASCSVDIAIVRVLEDIPWNIGGVRNLAMLTAPTKFVFVTDIDIHAPKDFYSYLLRLANRAEQEASIGNHLIFTSFKRVFEASKKESRPHPAVMFLSKDTYWRVGGCDEDFVGNYGYTDPHFWHRARRTQDVYIVNCHSDFPEIPSLVEKFQPRQYKRKRDGTVNMALFEQKKSHNNWSQLYLRFSWAMEQPACVEKANSF